VLRCPTCRCDLDPATPAAARCRCGFAAESHDGFAVFAPRLAHSHDGFGDHAHDDLAAVEDRHFWFTCRRELLVHLLRTHAPEARSYCEVGCGGGQILAAVAADRPGLSLWGVEASLAGLLHARRRVPAARLHQADATRLPFRDQFDAAGCFDVLEHLDDDLAALHGLHEALHPCGLLLVSVPQHRWLWSWVDEVSCHRRRYARADLAGKLARAGFTVERWTSYLVWLLPLLQASRWRRPAAAQAPRLPRVVDAVGRIVTRGELAFTRAGWDHRWGGSLVCVARRRG
jgi:SAM-dependent methyltransferase